jgi:hypothetical protein
VKNIFIIIMLLVLAPAGLFASDAQKLLNDGFYINGADGKMVGPDSRGIFQFVTDADINDNKIIVRAGTSFELLPTSCLMKMRENYRPGEPYGFKLWAWVTTYNGENYLFAANFLPFKRIDEENQRRMEQTLKVNEPNGLLNFPPDILAKLTGGKEVLPIQVRPGLELKQDYIIADRAGRIEMQSDGQICFVFDALGRNVDNTKILLLPCQLLGKVLTEQKSENAPIRFKVSGIITKYNDNLYLLLQRAGPVFSNGNFPR